MKKYYVKEKHQQENLFITTALISMSMIITIQLINEKLNSLQLTIALYCFAISIPLLVGSIAALYLEKLYKIRAHIWYLWICNFFGCLLSIVGIGAVFFNFNWILGTIFLLCSLFTLFVIASYTGLLEKINDDNEKDLEKEIT
ncbi:hypothetical protein GON26_17835 [Flavobacterium sp. GA093]|uniref:DUF3021 domain-containing protein n=1 Tax=Flavobacterium hydrocarbonoxydans TaxID=2683249 RepID=A0A6I4NYW7_9FLAO|nr:hypothetical protein [Flavobacterium hydrocarbonoxydans]MWB96227.1 hypothetical protein [Flavobacterium hydrocarbonoxydans]